MPEKVLEENDRWYIATSPWGVTMKHFKEEDSTPEFLDFAVVDEDSWQKAKAQMTLEDDRIPWQMLKDNYDKWRAEGRWIRGMFWFGFDVTHSWMMGTENMLIALMEEPELVEDMFATYLDRSEKLFQRIWDAGYHFDELFWYLNSSPDSTSRLNVMGRCFRRNSLRRLPQKPMSPASGGNSKLGR